MSRPDTNAGVNDSADVVPLSSPQMAREHCEEYRNTVSGLLDGGSPSMTDSERGQSIRMLIRYSDLQVTRIALWADGPVDLLASATRNLLEWSLWCKAISEGTEERDILTDDFEADVFEMMRVNPVVNSEVYESVFPAQEERGPGFTAAIKQFQNTASEVLKAFGDENGRLPKRVQLSALRNPIDNFVFKMCSKLVHPTSVSIRMLPNETQEQLETKCMYLRSVALFYATGGLNLLVSGPS